METAFNTVIGTIGGCGISLMIARFFIGRAFVQLDDCVRKIAVIMAKMDRLDKILDRIDEQTVKKLSKE